MEHLREQRTRLGLSQSALARRAGVSRFRLNASEAGGPPLKPDEIARVADALRDRARQIRQQLAEAAV